MNLRTFLADRGVTFEAAGLLGGVAGSTISRICSGECRARPKTVVSLAKALGVNAIRMQRMCDASWAAAHVDEVVGV